MIRAASILLLAFLAGCTGIGSRADRTGPRAKEWMGPLPIPARKPAANTPESETRSTLLDSAPVVLLEHPNGGNRVTAGSLQEVRWSTFDANPTVGGVRLELSADDGRTWELIEDALPNTGVYEWIVPARPGEGYRVRVTILDESGQQGSDASDASFAIDAASGGAWQSSAERSDLAGRETRLQRPRNPAREAYRQGLQLAQEGRWEAAVRSLRRSIELNPRNPEPYGTLGKVFLDQGNFDDAATVLDAGLKVAENPVTRINLGIAHYGRRDGDRALEEFRRVVQLAPRVAEGHLYLGLVLAELGKRREARGHLEQAVLIAPGTPVAARALSAMGSVE